MKKVLFVATVVKLHIMVFHLPYLEWFKKKGYEVHVAARNDYDKKGECDIPFCDKYYDLPFERSPFKINNLHTYQKMKEIVDINDYEIIHSHTPVGGMIGRLASRNARRKGTKVIYTAHGFHFYKGAPLKNWLIYYPAERWLARYTDVLITINKEDYRRSKDKFKAKKVKYTPGVGIDVAVYENLKVDKNAIKKEIGIAEDSFLILSVGELNKNKNHEVVIKSLAEISDNRLHYIVCGQGYLETDLKELSKKLGIEDRVHLLGFRKDIAKIYKSVDLFIFPSFREGLSVSLMEAMASKLPIICSNIRGNSDLIIENKGGYLLDPNDYKAVSFKIMKLINEEKLRYKFGEYNGNFVKSFSFMHVEESLKSIYEDVNYE